MTRPYGTAPVTLADGRMAYERNAARPLDPPRPTLHPNDPHWTHWLVRVVAVGAIGFAIWMGVA